MVFMHSPTTTQQAVIITVFQPQINIPHISHTDGYMYDMKWSMLIYGIAFVTAMFLLILLIRFRRRPGQQQQQQQQQRQYYDQHTSKDENDIKRNEQDMTRRAEDSETDHDISDINDSSLPTNDMSVDGTTPPKIIYRVRTQEKGKPDRYFYQDVPFKGLRNPLIEDEQLPISIFDVYTDIEGAFRSGVHKESMKRSEYQDRSKSIRLDGSDPDFSVTVEKTTLLSIRHPLLREVFQKIVQYDPDHRMKGEFIPSHHPFPQIMWYYDDLMSLQQEMQDKPQDLKASAKFRPDFDLQKAATYLKKLLEFVESLYNQKIVPERNLHNSSNPAATFGNLWLLFKPGELAYVNLQSEYSAVIIIGGKHVPESKATGNFAAEHFRVSCWNYHLVNGMMVRHRSTIAIVWYEDPQQINNLPIFPWKYLGSKGDEYRRKLTERGEKFYKMVVSESGYAHKSYKGKTLDKEPIEYTGEIVIDPDAYVRYQWHRPQIADPDGQRIRQRFDRHLFNAPKDSFGSNPLVPDDVVEPEDSGGGLWRVSFDPKTTKSEDLAKEYPGKSAEDYYVLFPRIIIGMIMKDKRWAHFDVSQVSDVEWHDSDNALSKLVIPSESARLLKAACPPPKEKNFGRVWSPDYTQGKGAGKVFLLHGPPGTGKTFTAECMAKYNRQILLSLTVGDLGTDEVYVDSQLSKWFNLARKWQALLLIDEADVFMEARTLQDLRRNSLVSVFLRTMEYYEGTLFLTTNRIGQLDPAISSRVHVAIYYPPFNMNTDSSSSRRSLDRTKIWENLFDKLESRECFISHDARARIADTRNTIGPELSPREIRNAFTLAVQLSEYGSTDRSSSNSQRFELKFHDLETAVKMRERFKKQCHKAAGFDSEQERAEMTRDRGPDEEYDD